MGKIVNISRYDEATRTIHVEAPAQYLGCLDCRFCQFDSLDFGGEFPRCAHPAYSDNFARLSRRYGPCGPNAKYYEPASRRARPRLNFVVILGFAMVIIPLACLAAMAMVAVVQELL